MAGNSKELDVSMSWMIWFALKLSCHNWSPLKINIKWHPQPFFCFYVKNITFFPYFQM